MVDKLQIIFGLYVVAEPFQVNISVSKDQYCVFVD
jgi:hypothetical protein